MIINVDFNSFCRSATEEPGSKVGETAAGEDDLDKDFWIRRAGEVRGLVCL